MNSSVKFPGKNRRALRRVVRFARGRAGVLVALIFAVGVALGVVLLVGPALAASFPDVHSDTYADPDYPAAVSALSDLGVIGGFSDGTFRPHDPVTRQQFAKMIVKLLGLPVTGSEVCPFTDVAGQIGTDPFYPSKYVAVCAARGITSGKSASTFAPNDNITRAQLLSMVVRGARQSGIILLDPTSAYYAGTSEGSHFFSTWVDANHAANAQAAEFNGLLWGIWAGNTWSPYENATRGEVAQILWRLKQKMGGGSGTTTTTQLTTTTTTKPTTTTTTAVGSGTLVRSDDFSDPSNGWPNDAGWSNGVYHRYENGAYVVELKWKDEYPEWPWETFYYGSLNLADVRVEADVTLASGNQYSGAGLLLRYLDKNNYYVFEISGQGEYSVWRKTQNQWQSIVDWTQSSALKPKGSANHIVFAATGATLTATVNGTQVVSVTDAILHSGSGGFYVETYGFADVKAIFDNLKIWSLP